jgi:hypothetical protein
MIRVAQVAVAFHQPGGSASRQLRLNGTDSGRSLPRV